MENTSKYYTPDITEFHIGFEFEWLYTPVRGGGKQKWRHYTIDKMDLLSEDINGENGFEDILYQLEKNEIRVKHVNRTDIESIGFKYLTKTNSTEVFTKEIDKIHTLNVYALYKNNIFSVIGYSKDGQSTQFYHGYIKNRTELNKIINNVEKLYKQ